MIELYETASWATSELGVPVFVGTPLEPLGDPSLLDHAGRFETSQLLAVRPDLVRMEDLPDDTVSLVDAVLGEHPRLGSAAEGEQLFARALDSWAEWLEDSTGLGMYYQRAIDQYDDYRTQFYRESWEQAIADWWASKG